MTQIGLRLFTKRTSAHPLLGIDMPDSGNY